MKNNKKTRLNGWEALIWCVFLLCVTTVTVVIQLQSSPISIIRFEMDNNTAETINNIYNRSNCMTPSITGWCLPEIETEYFYKYNNDKFPEAATLGLCPINTTQKEVQCDCAKNTVTPCMAYCWKCINLSNNKLEVK